MTDALPPVRNPLSTGAALFSLHPLKLALIIEAGQIPFVSAHILAW
jgi:hypothetical protein